MTPAEFVARCEATIDDLALCCAHQPDDVVDKLIDRVLSVIRPEWLDFFNGAAEPQDIAEAVNDIGERVQKRRREIEAAGFGTA